MTNGPPADRHTAPETLPTEDGLQPPGGGSSREAPVTANGSRRRRDPDAAGRSRTPPPTRQNRFMSIKMTFNRNESFIFKYQTCK